MRLLLVPLLMPLLIVPATTNWFEKGIREEEDEEATEPVKYEIWLSPDRKLTAALVPASGDPGTPGPRTSWSTAPTTSSV